MSVSAMSLGAYVAMSATALRRSPRMVPVLFSVTTHSRLEPESGYRPERSNTGRFRPGRPPRYPGSSMSDMTRTRHTEYVKRRISPGCTTRNERCRVRPEPNVGALVTARSGRNIQPRSPIADLDTLRRIPRMGHPRGRPPRHAPPGIGHQEVLPPRVRKVSTPRRTAIRDPKLLSATLRVPDRQRWSTIFPITRPVSTASCA